MPETSETVSWFPAHVTSPNNKELREALKRFFIKEAIEEGELGSTLRTLNKPSRTSAVLEGVLERNEQGLYDAALSTEEGRVVLRDARRTDQSANDPQVVFAEETPERRSSDPNELLSALKDSREAVLTPVLCCIEFARFNQEQRLELLPLLWNVISHQRDINDPSRLVGVAAAVRKYISIMPMERLGELAVLFKSGDRSQISIELEIEIAKMVYRNFEVHPPKVVDSQPKLADALWDLANLYTNPRLLLRGKHSAAASISIQALVSMRSGFAPRALELARSSPYRWFAEVVSDGLSRLSLYWHPKNIEAATWLDGVCANQNV